MVSTTHGLYQLTDDLQKIDFSLVHSWLTSSYWTPGISREEVERGAKNSALVIGAFDPHGTQAGYMRVVSDKTRFAYLMDVFVDPAHRKKGLAQAMIRLAFEHLDFKSIRQWLLATKDAGEVYRSLGFKPLEHPERWMAVIKQWAQNKT